MKRIPFLDLKVSDPTERAEIMEAVEAVLLHGRIVIGPEVETLEKKIAEICNRKYAVGVNSGSEALFTCLRALGIGPEDEVITTSLSWIATTNAIAMTGATPVFADITDDLNISSESIEKLITPATKAIIPVHYTGKMCDMNKIMELAKQHNLLVIEDAAQAFGAKYNGEPAGSIGDAACFSFNSMKVLASCGEAGIILTDSEETKNKLQSLRYSGTINRETCIQPSLNGRLHTIQAAILLKRLQRLNKLIRKRNQIAQFYDSKIGNYVTPPTRSAESEDVYYTYTIQAEKRDELMSFLEKKGIETKIQHPILMPEQPAYSKNTRGEWSNAKKVVKKILCLPANEKLSQEDIAYVADCIKAFYSNPVK